MWASFSKVRLTLMHRDHGSYTTSHDQLADTFQCLGAQLGSTFIEGGIQTRFDTCSFMLQLQNGHYLEVGCQLDQPSSDSTPFGKAVSQRSTEGVGWLKWVVALDDVYNIEKRLGRTAVNGRSTKPDGKNLAWKQIGVLGTLEDKQLQLFIEWLPLDHPSTDGKSLAKIVKVEIAGDESRIEKWLGLELRIAVGSGVEVKRLAAKVRDGELGKLLCL